MGNTSPDFLISNLVSLTFLDRAIQLTKHWTFKSVHTGDFFGFAPTVKTVFVEGSTIARMKNGIRVEEQDFFDNLNLLTQLGLNA